MLRSQGFSRPLGPSTSVRHIGTIAQAGRSYEIFQYVHKERAAQVEHGRQSVVFLENGTRYVGAYEAYTADCRVKQNVLRCRSDEVGAQSVRLVRGRPPAQALIDGEISPFYK